MRSDGKADRSVRSDVICHHLLEMGTLGEVLVVAAKGTFDQSKGRLYCRNTGAKHLGLFAQDAPALGGICGSDQRADDVEGESCLLGAQNDGDACEVGTPIAAAASGVAGGREQSHRFPVAQDVRSQTEAFREGADAYRLALTANRRPVLA